MSATEKEAYVVGMKCGNCGSRFNRVVPYGVPWRDMEGVRHCPDCGCDTACGVFPPGIVWANREDARA